MSNRRYAVLLILQMAVVGLLLYVAFGRKSEAVRIVVPPNRIEPAAAAQHDNLYGLTPEDAARLKPTVPSLHDNPDSQTQEDAARLAQPSKETIARYRATRSETVWSPSYELGEIDDDLLSDLERYEKLLEDEKKRVGAELARRISESKDVKELTTRISEALREVEVDRERGANESARRVLP